MKVLLIDDSKFLRLASQRSLAKAGYEVWTAADGEEGLRIVREKQPDVVILDLMLPKMPGIDVLRAIKQTGETKQIPVIVQTGLSERNREKLIAEGAAGFIEKSEALLAGKSESLVEAIAQVGRSIKA
jgi:CheY-like chemotaxis protein